MEKSKIESAIGTFLLILQMVGPILDLVRQIEVAIPGKGQGSAKLALLQNAIAAASTPEVTEAIPAQDLAAVVGKIATATVASLNAAGVFAFTFL